MPRDPKECRAADEVALPHEITTVGELVAWLKMRGAEFANAFAREHARRCGELAITDTTPEARTHFASLATSWIKLASELEGAQAFVETMDQIEAKAHDEPHAA
jgi:hypothetical protein